MLTSPLDVQFVNESETTLPNLCLASVLALTDLAMFTSEVDSRVIVGYGR